MMACSSASTSRAKCTASLAMACARPKSSTSLVGKLLPTLPNAMRARVKPLSCCHGSCTKASGAKLGLSKLLILCSSQQMFRHVLQHIVCGGHRLYLSIAIHDIHLFQPLFKLRCGF